MKKNLKDTAFIIPIRIDSIIRLENLLLTIESLKCYFDTTIVVIEASSYNNKIVQSLVGEDILYCFVEDKDPIFYRTRYINIASSLLETKIIGVWDADVILDPDQILEAVEQIRIGLSDVSYPYNGIFLDTSSILRECFFLNRDLNFLKKHKAKMHPLYSTEDIPYAVGGAFLIAADKYTLAGGENEFFYGWGPEDGERFQRWKKLGYKIFRSAGCLYHLSHPRDINGGIGMSIFPRQIKGNLLKIIEDMTKEELSSFLEVLKSVRTR